MANFAKTSWIPKHLEDYKHCFKVVHAFKGFALKKAESSALAQWYFVVLIQFSSQKQANNN